MREEGQDLDLRTTSARRDIEYDALGRLTYYKDVSRSLDGVTDVETTTYFGIDELGMRTLPVYDSVSRLKDYWQKTVEQSISDAGVSLNLTTQTHRYNISYDSVSRMTGYDDYSRQEGQDLNLRTTSTRTLIEYDALGRLTYYKDISQSI